MTNTIFLEIYSSLEEYRNTCTLKLPLESYTIFCIYKYCSPKKINVEFVCTNKVIGANYLTLVNEENVRILHEIKTPWQVASCKLPVVLYEDTIITGLCAVARHICKFKSQPPTIHEHEEGLLGFRKGCLQAPNEVSIWTKFCEIDIIKTIKDLLSTQDIHEIPTNVVRFENHLGKPIRLHNVYKIAREQKKEDIKNTSVGEQNEFQDETTTTNGKTRIAKSRKWKSNIRKELEINCSTKVEHLGISHCFAEGPFIMLADLLLLPSYYILFRLFGHSTFKSHLPLTYKWFNQITGIPELEHVLELMRGLHINTLIFKNIVLTKVDDVSLYKCDPKRHNPKKRLFTKENDIENALAVLSDGMEFQVYDNEFEKRIDWTDIPDGANPLAGHLPNERMIRKSQQLENLTLAVLRIAKEGDLIVDFCSGSGHLGILVAYLLPKCTIILLENKEQSLLRARHRVHEMGLTNILFFQCNLDFFTGKFDIGIALHACGIASDLVLDKCLLANAKFVLCPCCYGSLHVTDRLVYPRSHQFNGMSIEQYLCIGHAADQTHKDHPLTVRGAKCMAVIDSDRAHLAKQLGYNVTLSRLQPLSCTPKNNLLIGIPILK